MSDPCKYREQYERVKRWYERLSTINQGRQHDLSSVNYEDEVYIFFLNCYHLKDLIKNDAAAGSVAQKKVEKFIESSRSLSLCADICNAHKHLKLTTSKSHENPIFGKKNHSLHLGSGLPTTISVKYEIDTTNGKIDAFTLATDCISEWESFISTYCKC